MSCPFIYLFIYLFIWIVILSHSLPLTTAAIFLLRLFKTEPVTGMKISSETESQLLPLTAPALELNIHEKRVAGHSPRYSRAKNVFEEEIFVIL